MVFCAAEGGGRQDIAFPHQSEIKVNGGEVKANLRGLKNKPGSTRPVDITKELRLNIPAYSNNVEMTYALTSKVGGRSEVSFLNPPPLFPAIPNCLSPFAPLFGLTANAAYRNFISSSMWCEVYLSRILWRNLKMERESLRSLLSTIVSFLSDIFQ
jgi:hypothetical protein